MDRPDDPKPPHRALSDAPDIATITLRQLEEDMLLPGIIYEGLRHRCHALHDKGARCGVGLVDDQVCPCGRIVTDGVGSATCFWLNDVVNKANATQFLEAARDLDAKLNLLERPTLAPEPPPMPRLHRGTLGYVLGAVKVPVANRELRQPDEVQDMLIGRVQAMLGRFPDVDAPDTAQPPPDLVDSFNTLMDMPPSAARESFGEYVRAELEARVRGTKPVTAAEQEVQRAGDAILRRTDLLRIPRCTGVDPSGMSLSDCVGYMLCVLDYLADYHRPVLDEALQKVAEAHGDPGTPAPHVGGG